MKRVFLISCSLFCLLSSCTEDVNNPEIYIDPVEYIQSTWILVKSVGNYEGAVQEGDDLEWEESYVFYENETFVKKRSTDEESFEASGTYSFDDLSDNDKEHFLANLTLIFTSGDGIVGDCYGDDKETMVITKAGQLRNNWGACDGPILFYEKQ